MKKLGKSARAKAIGRKGSFQSPVNRDSVAMDSSAVKDNPEIQGSAK